MPRPTGILPPVRTASTIDTPGRYDYTPSVVAGRIFWTGQYRGDAILSCRLTGPLGATRYTDPHALVADPAAMATGTGFVVFFTRGDKGGPTDGRRNGVCAARFTSDGLIAGDVATIIPPSANPDTYGSGQPTVAALPSDRYLLIYRADNDADASQLVAVVLSSITLDVVERLRFGEAEDGASPEAFYVDDILHILLVGVDAEGKGWAGLRRYYYGLPDFQTAVVTGREALGSLRRDRSAERAYPITGGSFWALPGAVPITNGIDGAGIVRDRNNDPVIRNGRLTAWRGWRNSLTRSPDWRLVKFTIPLP